MISQTTGMPYQSDGNLRVIRDVVQEVGKLAVASQGVFGALRAGIASIQSQVVSFVALANPAAVQRFKIAVDDLYGVIGRALVPVLNSFTVVIQKVADYFHALSPAAKTLMAGLTTVAIGFTVTTIAIWAFNAAATAATGGLWGLVGAIGSIAVGVITATASLDEMKGFLDSFAGPLSQIIDEVSKVMLSLAYAVLPILQTVMDVVLWNIRNILQVVQFVTPFIERMAIYFRAVAEVLAELFQNNDDRGKNDKVPGKAPPAVRQSQMGDLSSLISRQYVNAYQGGSPEQKRDAALQNIVKEVAMVKKDITDILKEVKDIFIWAKTKKDDIKNAANQANNAVADVAFPAWAVFKAIKEARDQARAVVD